MSIRFRGYKERKKQAYNDQDIHVSKSTKLFISISFLAKYLIEKLLLEYNMLRAVYLIDRPISGKFTCLTKS
jgi:hypothetical protein